MDFKSLKMLLITLFFGVGLLVGSTPFAAKTAIICDQEYVLCTSARCIPDPKDPTRAICECATGKGKSVGYKSCALRKPKQGKYNITYLVSTFSFEQFASKKYMTCPAGSPWADCVDMPCTVDPVHADRAICNCKIETTQAFYTLGGDCDTKSCTNGFWSAASSTTDESLRTALSKATGENYSSASDSCTAKTN